MNRDAARGIVSDFIDPAWPLEVREMLDVYIDGWLGIMKTIMLTDPVAQVIEMRTFQARCQRHLELQGLLFGNGSGKIKVLTVAHIFGYFIFVANAMGYCLNDFTMETLEAMHSARKQRLRPSVLSSAVGKARDPVSQDIALNLDSLQLLHNAAFIQGDARQGKGPTSLTVRNARRPNEPWPPPEPSSLAEAAPADVHVAAAEAAEAAAREALEAAANVSESAVPGTEPSASAEDADAAARAAHAAAANAAANAAADAAVEALVDEDGANGRMSSAVLDALEEHRLEELAMDDAKGGKRNFAVKDSTVFAAHFVQSPCTASGSEGQEGAAKRRRTDAVSTPVPLATHTATIKVHYSGGCLVFQVRGIGENASYRRQLIWPLNHLVRVHTGKEFGERILVTFDLSSAPRVDEWRLRPNPQPGKQSGDWAKQEAHAQALFGEAACAPRFCFPR